MIEDATELRARAKSMRECQPIKTMTRVPVFCIMRNGLRVLEDGHFQLRNLPDELVSEARAKASAANKDGTFLPHCRQKIEWALCSGKVPPIEWKLQLSEGLIVKAVLCITSHVGPTNSWT
jgi:hypothetical protein